jgi:hypothetical protein
MKLGHIMSKTLCIYVSQVLASESGGWGGVSDQEFFFINSPVIFCFPSRFSHPSGIVGFNSRSSGRCRHVCL